MDFRHTEARRASYQQNEAMSETTTTLQKTEEKAMEFVPYGNQDKIKLTLSIIKNLVAVPTRSGKTCSDKEALKAMMMMQARRLNPFEADCFLVGYDNRDGVATFALITAHQAFLKRAELHPEFDGMESGIVLLDEDGKLSDREGDFHLPEENVVGGWAKVHFKNRKFPIYRRLSIAKMRKPSPFWDANPAGQIVKCSEADALRSAFPTMCGGLVLRDEIDFPINGGSGHEMPKLQEQVPSATNTVEAEVIPAASGEAPKKPSSPIEELKEKILGEGFTFAQLNAWAQETGNFEQPVESFEKVDLATAKRLLRGWKLMKQGLEQVRDAQSNEECSNEFIRG